MHSDEQVSGGERSLLVAIALVSCTVLIYEIAITRILSVVLWYHFAFLSVSLAMLALGAPGIWFSLRPARPRALRIALQVSAILVPLSIVAIFKLGALLPAGEDRSPLLGAQPDAGWRVLLVLVSVLPPLLALGTAVCLLLMSVTGRAIGRMYGADLLGATAGALLVIPLMNVVPTPVLLAGSALLPLAALAVLFPSRRRAAGLIATALAASIAWGAPYTLRYNKLYEETGPLLYEKWTPTARLTVFDTVFWKKDPKEAFNWGLGTRFSPHAVEQLWIEQDGSAGTPVTRLGGGPESLEHLLFDVTSVGYQLRVPRTVCIIGAGGGRDILTAREAGAQEIDAIEINPQIVDLVSGRFREFSGDVYHLPHVNAVVSEGRSFLTRTDKKYDLIQISLIDTWAATAAGAFALSENYLYTEEALRLYWNRLSDDGVVSISRWMMGRRQLEGLRLALLARFALEREGVADPLSHLAVVQAGRVGTLLVSRRPFDAERLSRLDEVVASRGLVRHWPQGAETPAESRLAQVLVSGWESMREQGFDLTPPTDDRPFFFQTVGLFGDVNRDALASLSANDQSVVTLRRLLVGMAVLALAAFSAPLVLARALPRRAGIWRGTAYFAAIGLAFMFVEAPWIQRFILYLGHPSYATAVVLGTLLLGAGLGAMTAARARLAGRGWAFLLPLAVLAAELLLGPVFRASLGWGFPARVATSVLLLALPGYLMGFAFPVGMIRFGDAGKPWFWAINGVASVLASVCSLALAILAGFHDVALAGVVLYAAAAVLLPPGRR